MAWQTKHGKSRKALNYEWTTMRPEGEAPVKTVNIDEPPASERPAPVKTVDVPATKSDAAVPAPTPAEPDVEKQMAAILKEFTVSAAIQLLQGKFEKAADVRRSRMALFTFLKDNPEAVAFLQEQAKQKKAAKKPAKKTTTAKKTARRTAIKQAAAESSAEGKTEKPVAKKPAAKRPHLRNRRPSLSNRKRQCRARSKNPLTQIRRPKNRHLPSSPHLAKPR